MALHGPTDGSIPARAGEPARRTRGGPSSAVYPRPCGGAAQQATRTMRARGLSPPVRGSHGAPCRDQGATGSIPARAGEPRTRDGVFHNRGVYPRPCGGAKLPPSVRPDHVGLSPPVRGSLADSRRAMALQRSIPARAGEPTIVAGSAYPEAVYPRPCGGARGSGPKTSVREGLSPPVRGSLLRHRHNRS